MGLPVIHIEDKGNDSVLKKESAKVAFPLSNEDQQLITLMKKKLNELGGVGLAAPQVNVGKKIIAIYIPEQAVLLRDNAIPYPMHIMINPSYAPIEKAGKTSDFEACYSVQSKAGKVQRYQEIQISYQDETGQKHTQQEHGFYARVLQHEIDHLNGLLITDRLRPADVQGSIAEMMALRRDELPEDKKKAFDKVLAEKGIEVDS